MAYTTAQQTRIDTASAKVSSTKADYDKIQATVTELDRVARGINETIFQCLGYKGKTKNYEILSENDCETCAFNSNCPDCKTKSECQRRVRAFNNAYRAWQSQLSTRDNRKAAYDLAKEELGVVLDAIAKEANNDPAVIISNNALKAQENISQSILKSKTTQIIIFAVVALLIVGILIAVLKR